jgi:hypothetical protein
MTRPKGGQSEKNFDMADSFLVALHTVKSYREHVLRNSPDVMSAIENSIRGSTPEEVPAPKKRRSRKQADSSAEEAEEQEEQQKGKSTRASKRTEEKKLGMKQLRMLRAVSDEAFPPGKSPLGKLVASEHLLLTEQPPASPASGSAEHVASV